MNVISTSDFQPVHRYSFIINMDQGVDENSVDTNQLASDEAS